MSSGTCVDKQLCVSVGDGAATLDGASSSGLSGDSPAGDELPGEATNAGSCSGPEACVDAPPSGWVGPLLVLGAPTPDAGTACTDPNYSTPYYHGQGGFAAQGAQCTCNCPAATATGATCQIVLSNASDCSSSCQSATLNNTTTCSPFDASSCTGGGSYYALGETTPMGASCGSPTFSMSLPVPTWSVAVVACGLPQSPVAKGCAPGRVCAPPSSGPLCVMQTGDVGCPSGTSYATKHVYYGGFDEGRSCSTCACKTVGTGSCSAQFNLFTATGCSGSTQILQVTFGTCTSIPAGTHSVDLNLLTLTEPSCAPSGGVAQGSAIASTPTTLCCTL